MNQEREQQELYGRKRASKSKPISAIIYPVSAKILHLPLLKFVNIFAILWEIPVIEYIAQDFEKTVVGLCLGKQLALLWEGGVLPCLSAVFLWP